MGIDVVRGVPVLVVDDDPVVRWAVCQNLTPEEGFRVIAEAADGRTAVEAAVAVRPDLVVMDLGMPDLDGLAATRQIKAQLPATQVVPLSMYGDEEHVSGALRAGASGYVVKEDWEDDLVLALRAARRGESFLSPAVSPTESQGDFGQASPQDRQTDVLGLTTREREVLHLVADGLASKAIATRLGISTRTVEAHRAHLMAKLGLRTVAELTRYAVGQGMITPIS